MWAVALLPILAGCGAAVDALFEGIDDINEEINERPDGELLPSEFQALGADVADLMTVVFQAGEQAFLGEDVEPGEVIEPPSAANDFAVTYNLPTVDRPRLGRGFGRVTLRILEDGVPVQDPLGFTYAGSAAAQVQIIYNLDYAGQAAFTPRSTDVDLLVDLIVERDNNDDLTLTDYLIEGVVDLGQTVTHVSIDFRALGAPVDGIENDGGQADIEIDDPEVIQVLEATADLFETFFQVSGNVRGCCPYADNFLYTDVGL